MRHRAALAGLLLTAVAAGAGCGSDPGEPATHDPDAPVLTSSPVAGPASVDNPLGEGTLGTDAYAFRDALVETIREAGGARITVTGRPSATAVALVHDQERQRFARRFTWQAGGATMELLELANGRVCANLAAGKALEAAGNTAMGYLEASDRPYSCTTRRDGLAGFLVYGYSALDPVTRLAGLMGDVTLTDLGTGTDQDGVPTRHLQVRATESDRSLRSVPTTYDLWVDADLRPVRAELTSLDEDFGPYVATFAYDGLPTVALPDAADRGGFVLHPGGGPGPRP